MLGQDRDDHRRVFRPLGFVDGPGVGMDQFIEVGVVLGNFPVIDGHLDYLGLLIDGDYPPDVPVEDLLVVVGDLHDPVMDLKGPPPTDYPILPRIEGLVEFDIEVPGPNDPRCIGVRT